MPIKYLALDKDYVKIYHSQGLMLPEQIKKSVYKRQNQFAAGRLCAMELIYKTTGKIGLINQDELKRPVWPEGVVGSISHTDEVAISLVKKSNEYLGVGIDIEKIDSSHDVISSLENIVINKNELELLKELTEKYNDIEYSFLIFLIFSIKESFYKCINPIINITFDFSYVDVTALNLSEKSIKLTLVKSLNTEYLAEDIFEGSFEYLDEYQSIITFLSLCRKQG